MDYQQIRQEVNIEEVARWLGIPVQNGKARCPFHNDQTPSLSFKEGRYKCFGCDASGDAIDLVAKLRHLSTAEAAQRITEAFHIHTSAPVQKKLATMNHEPISRYIDQCIEAFAVAPAAQMYLQSRGFTGEHAEVPIPDSMRKERRSSFPTARKQIITRPEASRTSAFSSRGQKMRGRSHFFTRKNRWIRKNRYSLWKARSAPYRSCRKTVMPLQYVALVQGSSSMRFDLGNRSQ